MNEHQTDNSKKISFMHRSIFYYLLISILILILVNSKLAFQVYTRRQSYIYDQYPDLLSKIIFYDNINRIAPYADQLEALANIYSSLGQHDDAIAAIKRAMRLNPKAADRYRQILHSMDKNLKR